MSQHAATRYQERVKPALDFVAAKAELERLIGMCDEMVPELDWWPADDYGQNVGYLEVAPGVACPVVQDERGRLIAATCCAYGSFGGQHRRARNAWKREQRKRRRRKKAGPRVAMEVDS